MQKVKLLSAMFILAATISSCQKNNDEVLVAPAPVPAVKVEVFVATGSIDSKLAEFRTRLGSTLNTAPGATGGRREINWDAVPPAFTNNNNFPHDFFGSFDPALPNGRKRGFVITNTSTSFRVDSTEFDGINTGYEAEVDVFSPKRLFAAIGSNITDCAFKIPGSNSNAFIRGFGVIFTDVDIAGGTTLEFFSGTKSLGKYSAPPRTTGSSFSFLGLYFPEEKVTSVQIVTGNGLLSGSLADISSGGTKDIVAMDDFLYNEPEPFN